MEVCDPDTRNWIQWWYWDRPIPDDPVQSFDKTAKEVNDE